MKLSVSIIIPVYNAASFVTQAVESALAQHETAEVILVEDHSSDNSLEVCQALTQLHPQVRLYKHRGGVNRGAGPSRNLGMEKSTAPFIAFLDADDYYLPGRFTIARNIFINNPSCDGVYEAVGIHYEDEQGKRRWLTSDMAKVEMTTIREQVTPGELFKLLIKGGSGHIHLNGLVIKRSVLKKTGYMNERIADTLHEDTDFILKLAAVGNLLPGRLSDPVSMRRVHSTNRVSAPRPIRLIYRDHMKLRIETYRWCKKQRLIEARQLAFHRLLSQCGKEKPIRWIRFKQLTKSTQKWIRLLFFLFEYPEIALEGFYWSEISKSIWGTIRNMESHQKVKI